MPSLIDIRRRIRSVKSTQQITRAMKLVSAAKLRRAQDRVINARPYSAMFTRLLANLAEAARTDETLAAHPLLARRPERRIQLILVTADRGMAGAFNANLVKAAVAFLEEHKDAEVLIEAVGRKGRDFFRKQDVTFSGEMVGMTDRVAYSHAVELGNRVRERFTAGEIDAVYLLYNEFKSVLTQKLTVERLLPLTLPEHVDSLDYIYEQPPQQLLAKLLPRYVEVGIYSALLESGAAQQAARMTAMDAATSNASDMIARLTLHMNRVRQASITTEIVEIVGGAAAVE